MAVRSALREEGRPVGAGCRHPHRVRDRLGARAGRTGEAGPRGSGGSSRGVPDEGQHRGAGAHRRRCGCAPDVPRSTHQRPVDQCRALPASGARAQHRGRPRRHPRPRLRGLLRGRWLHRSHHDVAEFTGSVARAAMVGCDLRRGVHGDRRRALHRCAGDQDARRLSRNRHPRVR